MAPLTPHQLRDVAQKLAALLASGDEQAIERFKRQRLADRDVTVEHLVSMRQVLEQLAAIFNTDDAARWERLADAQRALDRADAKPAGVKPADLKPADLNPTDVQPAHAERAKGEPAHDERAKGEPAHDEPADAEPETPRVEEPLPAKPPRVDEPPPPFAPNESAVALPLVRPARPSPWARGAAPAQPFLSMPVPVAPVPVAPMVPVAPPAPMPPTAPMAPQAPTAPPMPPTAPMAPPAPLAPTAPMSPLAHLTMAIDPVVTTEAAPRHDLQVTAAVDARSARAALPFGDREDATRQLSFSSMAQAFAMSVEEYAALCAERDHDPAAIKHIHARYAVVDSRGGQALDRLFYALFAEAPETRKQWQGHYQRYVQLLRER